MTQRFSSFRFAERRETAERAYRLSSWTIYLPLCVMMGGASAAGAIPNWILQVAAIAILAREFLRQGPNSISLPTSYRVALLAIATIAIVQLTPLPIAGAGIHGVARGVLATISVERHWVPLSATPMITVASLLALLPAAAIAIALLRRDTPLAMLPPLVVGVALLSLVLGLLQVRVGGDSPLYLYEITNRDAPVGFFANRNHFATLMLMALPCAVFMLRQQESHTKRQSILRLSGVFGVATITFVALLVNGSDAGILLFFPVIVASALLYRNVKVPGILLVSGLIVLAAVLAIGTINASALNALLHRNDILQQDRSAIWMTTLRLIATSFPFGTGLGSFAVSYANLEDPTKVTPIFVNHAHNDYLEVCNDLGLLGVSVVILFLLWWGRRAVQIWTATDSLAKLGVVMSSVVIVHSVVDYPARTAAISALLAAALALMVRHDPGQSASAAEVGR